jgi:DNA-binding NtrC family response regulator
MRTLTVLVADDEEGIRALFEDALRDAGYDVALAASGREVLETLKARPIDLVITDLVMPDQDGIDILRAIRRGNPRVKTIAMSGAADFLTTARLLGANATLAKPVTAKELLQKVRQVCGEQA